MSGPDVAAVVEPNVDATGEILAALIEQRGEGIWATELAFDGGVRRCDFWTISANSSQGFSATAYEIKVSRSDFKRDNPMKQRQARLFSDRFYYVAPRGLIKPDELPEWAGLLECHEGRLSAKVNAPLRDKDAPTWQFVVSLIRNSGEVRRDFDANRKRILQLERAMKDAAEKLKEMGFEPWKVGLWN